MDFYQRAKRYSIEKFTTSAFSLLANASTENLIRLTHLAEKIPQKSPIGRRFGGFALSPE